MNKEIVYDLANEVVRHYGAVEVDLAPKIASRVQQKFHTQLDMNTISDLIRRYQGVYAFAASILRDCLLPSSGEYASLNDVDVDKYTSSVFAYFLASF